MLLGNAINLKYVLKNLKIVRFYPSLFPPYFMMVLCDNVVISDNITLILSAWPEFLWRHMRQSVPVWSRTLFIWRGNNLNIPCLPDPGKFRGMNTKLILYTKSFILNVVKESRVARQARHSVSFLRSLVTMAVTRPRFCPPHSSPLLHCWWRWQMLPMSSLSVAPTLSRPMPSGASLK